MSGKNKILWWLILHQPLPINTFRYQRGMAPSPIYCCCGKHAEDVSCCLKYYPPSLLVWRKFGLAFGFGLLICLLRDG